MLQLSLNKRANRSNIWTKLQEQKSLYTRMGYNFEYMRPGLGRKNLNGQVVTIELVSIECSLLSRVSQKSLNKMADL